ncbi:MAG: CrcB family protein [Firmicutes bacterium]|nr:CrcB family protein [Bacillota bacterium]
MDTIHSSKRNWLEPLKQYAAVGLGGLIGAPLREGVELLVPSLQSFPLATLIINWSGSFFLAWFYTISIWKWRVPQWFRAGLGTGVIGAYTTFSTFSVETVKLFHKGKAAEAIVYLVLSLLGGFAFAFLGARLGGEKKEAAV